MQRKRLTSLFVIGAFVAFFLGSGMLSNMVQPWLHASEPHCAKYDQAAHAYRNVCDHPINFGWTARKITAPVAQKFSFVTLAPDAATTEWRQTARTLPKGHRFYYWACKAPHIPRDAPDSDHAGRMKTGCGKGTDDA